MSIWQTIVALNVAALAALFFSVVFVTFVDEWRRQRQAHLALFAASAVFAAGALGIFIAALFQAGMKGYAPENALTIPSSVLVSLSLMTVGVGAATAFFRRSLLPLYLLLAFLPFVGRFFLSVITGQEWTVEAIGTNLSSLGLMSFSLAAVVASVYFRRKRAVGARAHADEYLMIGGWCGVAASVLSYGWFLIDSLPALFGAVALAGLSAWFLSFGALAKSHGDPRVMASPTLYWRRHLAAKYAMVSFGLAWFCLMLLSGLVLFSEYRLRTAEAKQDLQIGVSQAASSYRQAAEYLLQNLDLYAQQPSVRAVLDMTATGTPTSSSLNLRRGVAQLYRLHDATGKVIWSNIGSSEIGRPNSDSSVAQLAGLGFRVTSIEGESSWGNVPVLKAGVPVASSSGSIGALVASAELRLAWPSAARSGVGFAVITNGFVLDKSNAFDWSRVHAWLKSAPLSLMEPLWLTDGTMVIAYPLHSTEGESVGWAVASLDSSALRIATIKMILPTLLVAWLLALLLAVIVGWQAARLARRIEDVADNLTKLAAGRPIDISMAVDADEVADLISADRQAIVSVKRQSNSFEQALRSERDFLTNVVREMRGPLNGLRWALDLLRFGDTGRLKRDQLEIVEHMFQSSNRLNRLVRNLSDASDLESGELKLKLTDVRIVDVLHEAAGALAVPIREKNLRLEWPAKTYEATLVSADRQRLYEIVLNLLSNAVKYTPDKGRILIGLAVVENPGTNDKLLKFAQVSIEDNGQGIPQADQSRIFDRFYRSLRSVSEEVEGAGLGLHIVKRLVDKHGGAMWFQSVENAGSTFHFTIPVVIKN